MSTFDWPRAVPPRDVCPPAEPLSAAPAASPAEPPVLSLAARSPAKFSPQPVGRASPALPPPRPLPWPPRLLPPLLARRPPDSAVPQFVRCSSAISLHA